jgi:signal transduction histidine kinase
MSTRTSTLEVDIAKSRLSHPAEWLRSLADPYTYSIRNVDMLFGFLWGIPIPFVTLAIHLHVAKLTASFETLFGVISEHPVYYFFAAHPVLFAIVFGVQGTLRRKRDLRIVVLRNEEIMRYEELRQANMRLAELDRLKSEFLANVTHELKSPLVTALGYTDRMIGNHLGTINDRQLKSLEISKRNLIRLRKLIDEILDFSRLDAGMARFDMAPMDLRETVHLAVENATLRAREKNISVHLSLPDTPVMVQGDSHKLLQVTINLLDNAVKFTNENGRIDITLAPLNSVWRLCVQDNGVGIPADIVPKLFERFCQVNGTLARPYSGVGLGLVIVKKIIQAHLGKVWIESILGVGTKLIVELPTVSVPLAVSDSTGTAEITPAKATRNLHDVRSETSDLKGIRGR